MKVLKIFNEHIFKYMPLELPDKLGEGSDGEVFTFGDVAIKFGVKFTETDMDSVTKIMNYLILNKNDSFVNIHKYVYCGEYDNKFLYYYIMDKLNCISDDESKVFRSIISHEDSNIKKNFSILEIKKMLKGMAVGLDFDAAMVIFFCERLQDSPVNHNDLHERNIMKDSKGYFHLIDFDRATIRN